MKLALQVSEDLARGVEGHLQLTAVCVLALVGHT
jgi:hypothetical protein